MGLFDVLRRFGFDPECRARMARHADTRSSVDFGSLLGSEAAFEEYIRWQSRPIYGDAEFVVTFVGDGPGRARFRGVHRVLGYKEVAAADRPHVTLWDWSEFGNAFIRYELSSVPGYEVLRDQLVIVWTGERTWVQHLRNNDVLLCPESGAVLSPSGGRSG